MLSNTSPFQLITNRTELFTLLREGAMVITPNNRLSQQYLRTYMRSQGKTVMDKPTCLPYEAFKQQLYQWVCKHHPDDDLPHLLNDMQTQHVLSAALAENDSMLSTLQQAYTDCKRWGLDIHHPTFQWTPQSREFQTWFLAVEKTLQRLNVTTAADIVRLSQDKLTGYVDTLANPVCIWACFTEYTPEQCTLQQTLEAQGITHHRYDLPDNGNLPMLHGANDPDSEYREVLHWLEHKLAQGEERLAVVVPALETEASKIARLIQHHLPEDAVDISLGQPLTQYPLVSHALSWLSLSPSEDLSKQTAKQLLFSSYIVGSKTEFLPRAQSLQDARWLQAPSISWQRFIHAIRPQCDILANSLEAIQPYPKEATPATWVHAFKTRLKQLGFPGDNPLQSTTYQCYQHFLACLDNFTQLTLVSPSMTRTEALSALEHLASRTIFQAQKNPAPIQIMGLLEAEGCSFDHLWVTGMSDQTLPQTIMPSPFIPMTLQREHNMPRALPEREMAFASQRLERMLRGSDTCVFSYPKTLGDAPQLPSPLISHFLPYSPTNQHSSRSKVALEAFEETYRIPLKPNESLTGGAAILAYQAQCPFRAFSAFRLNARTPDRHMPGLTPIDRGQLMHTACEKLWKDLGSQAQLLAQSEQDTVAGIEKAIHHAFQVHQDVLQGLPPLTLEVERWTLTRVLEGCLTWDAARPAFSIDALEKAYTIPLGGLEFTVRIDRLDLTEDGDAIIIDYKTSLPLSVSWLDERPEVPQLLLYALLDDRITSLLFLRLKPGQVKSKGISEEKTSIPGVRAIKADESWADYRTHWHTQLSSLATEYNEGQCMPQPKDASLCERCEFGGVCRVV